jgi:hypothetical protein
LDGHWVGSCSSYNDSLGALGEKILNPSLRASGDAIPTELVEKQCVVDLVQSLAEIQHHHVLLVALLHRLGGLVHKAEQLGFSGEAASKSMLFWTEDLVVFGVADDVFDDDVL